MLSCIFSTGARGAPMLASASRALATTKPPTCLSPAVAALAANHRPPANPRSYSTTTPTASLDEFRDSVPRLQRMKEQVGRQWTVKELRRKSFDDLHKLWYVLYKEKNMLLTEKYLLETNNLKFPQPYRWTKVKRSMKAIRVVLGERKRERAAQRALEQQVGDSD